MLKYWIYGGLLALTLLLSGLKCLSVIDLSWWLVLAPVYIPVALVACAIIIYMFFGNVQ